MRQQIPGQTMTVNGYSVDAEYDTDTVLMLNLIAVTGKMPNRPRIGIPTR